jgi:hypothetical protein
MKVATRFPRRNLALLGWRQGKAELLDPNKFAGWVACSSSNQHQNCLWGTQRVTYENSNTLVQ